MSAGNILFVLSNSDKLLTGHPTGFYVPELVHPLHVFRKAGYTVHFASPNGGISRVDPGSVEAFKEDRACMDFLRDEAATTTDVTLKLSEINDVDYKAIFAVGGHAPCFDLAVDPTSIALFEKFFASGRPTGAVCHGPAVFHKVKGPDGKSIFNGRRATCFSNGEEETVGLTKAIPFLIEDDIKANGGTYVCERGATWASEVVVDSTNGLTLITGGNPASAADTAEAYLKALA